MTTARRRWLLPVAAAVAVGLVVALSTCREDETPPAQRAGPPPVAEKAPAPLRSRRGAKPSGAAKVPEPGDSPAESQHGYVAEDDRFPFLDVEVVQHDGTPAANSTVVYALHAGTTTTAEPSNVAIEDGRCRLHVTRPGKYDVGGIDGAFAALVEDVDVPSADVVRITLPEPAAVLLIAESPLVPDVEEWPGADFRAFAAGGHVVSWPGRGQQIRWTVPGRVEPGTRRVDLVVPKGAAGGLSFDSGGVAAVPGTFTAPATLRLVRAGLYRLTLRVGFESPGASFQRLMPLSVEFRVGDVAEPTATWAILLAAGQPVGDAFRPPVLVRADANVSDGTITWRGHGVAPGSQPFSGLVRDTENIVDVSLRLDTDAPAPERRGPVHTTVHLRAVPGDDAGLPSIVRLFYLGAGGQVMTTEQAVGEDVPLRAAEGTWFAAARGNWTTDPVRLADPPPADGTTLTLQPGGWLVVALERRPPESLGPVWIRRKDGAPLLADDGATLARGVAAGQGVLLGPFPEGGVDLVLELSGEVVHEIHATVVAGKRETLRIPSLSPR